MPTGYTADIYDAAQNDKEPPTFEEFAWTVARAFGALITMRESPKDAVVPKEFQVDSYYQDSVDRAQEEYDEVVKLDDSSVEYRQEIHLKANKESLEREEASRKRLVRYCSALLAEAKLYDPPTEDHEGFKKYMIEQLEEEIGRNESVSWRSLTERVPVGAYRQQLVNAAKDHLKYAKESLYEARKKVAKQNAWVKALRESLEPANIRQSTDKEA